MWDRFWASLQRSVSGVCTLTCGPKAWNSNECIQYEHLAKLWAWSILSTNPVWKGLEGFSMFIGCATHCKISSKPSSKCC